MFVLTQRGACERWVRVRLLWGLLMMSLPRSD
jgi:hypothetical protein